MADMLLFGNLAGRPAQPRRFRHFRTELDDYYNDKNVKSRFRFNSDSIRYIVDLLSPQLARGTKRNHALSPTLQVLVALRYFASGNFLEVIGDTFGLPKSTVSRCITDVSKALVANKEEFIAWPSDEEKRQIKEAFFAKKGFPGVIGCIDGTHVRIQGPPRNENDFVNWKGFHSINVQAICDNKGLFTNVVAKWPGNAHDSFIFQDSGIHDKLQLEHKSVEDGVLIGDSGYGCKPFLMTPFPHPETPKQEAYNEALGKTRVKIEQTFGIFKRRFHLMHTEIRVDPSKATLLIGACAVLHNIAIIRNDVYNPPRGVVFEDDQPEVPPYEGPEDGLRIREYICQNYF
ncbi:putative nuclease HARBI1 [Nematostella vectensis]|uniref:putative nuclease HARBI1 n=1 Tax=Nematostella vectensis TaxID=45351 RepID=UPI00138FDC20|nr:putative nuclease HARBI1 [Nematostella vectensis]